MLVKHLFNSSCNYSKTRGTDNSAALAIVVITNVLIKYMTMILTALVNCFHPGRTVSTAVCWSGCMHVALALILMYVWAVGTFRVSSCVLLRYL